MDGRVQFLEGIRNAFFKWQADKYGKESAKTLKIPGRVEELVREKRAPLRLGTMYVGDMGEESEPLGWYQVPPWRANEENVKELMFFGGGYHFIYKNGKSEMGSTFTLTEAESAEVEQRIDAELERLGRPRRPAEETPEDDE